MPLNSTTNSTLYFTRCLGIYHLLERPTSDTFSTYISVIIILSVFSILSAFGNGLVIYVYLKQNSLQCTNTLLLMCLAFLDFVSAVLLEPLYVVRLLSEIFGFTSCVFILIVRRLLEYLRPVSFMTLALITIERYLALFKAITHRRIVTKQRILYVVLLIWFLWLIVICIRSFFPKITSAFYIFFTFVAFSLLMGNFVMYFKIGKLARLHSRPTRVSNAPGSLSIGYENPGSLSPGSTYPGVTYSQTRAGNAKDLLNGKRRCSTKIGIQPSESVVKTTRIDVQPPEKASIESGVLSTEGETSTDLGYDVETNNLQNNLKASNPQALDNTATIKAGSKDKAEINNCESDDESSTSETPKVKGRNITKVFENKENKKNFARTSSTHVNTLSINNTSVCSLKCTDDITGYIKTDQVSNANSPRQFQSLDFTKENASMTSQLTNKEKLETKTDSNDCTMLEPSDRSLFQARDAPDATENTTNFNSVQSFENTKQVRATIEVEIGTTAKKTAEKESGVLSTDGETSIDLSYDVETNNLQNNLKTSNSQALDNTATIKAGSKGKAEINNCESDDENSTSETTKVKDCNITKVFENKENEKNVARTSSTHVNTLSINNMSVCCLESSDDITGYIKTDQVSNANSPRQFQSLDFTKENASMTSQFTNKEKLETKTDLNDSTMLEPNDKSLFQAHDATNSTENTTNSNSAQSFENTKQVGDKIEVEIDATAEKTAEAMQLDEATRQVKKLPQIQNTEPNGSSTNFILKSIEKTNQTAHQTTSRARIKNNAKLETRERNATRTVFYIVAILTLCYLPISVLLVYLSFQKEPDATTLFIYVPIADTIALFNALVNPFIYCLKNRKMRAAVKSVLQRTRNSA